MQTIWLLSVSFCLFYKEVIAPPPSSQLSNSQGLCTAVFDRRTLLKPYLSKYEFLYQIYGEQNKGRHALSATLVPAIIKPLTLQNWLAIGSLPQTSEIYYDEINHNDVVLYNIYRDVLHLLLDKIHYWTKKMKDVRSIWHYLGYQKKTIDVINMAMTELFSRQRKRQVKIDSLAQLFYYSCDVQHMVRSIHTSSRAAAVKQQFTIFLTKFQYSSTLDRNKLTIIERNLVKNIKSNLRLVGKKTNTSFGVTISSMKLSILLYDTNDEQINLIRNRIVSPSLEEKTCVNLVWFYSSQNESNKINAYHLQILGVVATQVFGYVYNYFELLIKLRRFRLQASEQRIVEEFTTFVSAYMSVFIDRYFEFNGEISQELVDALFRLVYFLDPNNPQTPNGINLTEDEKVILNELELPTYSIYDYFDPRFEGNDLLETNMWALISNAVRILIVTFTDENMDNWNQLTRIEYENDDDKSTLLEYMNNNNDKAINILEKFAEELSIDQNLYEKYNLNGPFQMT